MVHFRLDAQNPDKKQGVKLFEMGWHPNFDLPGSPRIYNPILFEWVPIWHPLSFLLYLRHGFCSESEDVKGNRVNMTSFKNTYI